MNRKKYISFLLALIVVFGIFAQAPEGARAQAGVAYLEINGPELSGMTQAGLRVSEISDSPEANIGIKSIDGEWVLSSNDYIYFFVDDEELRTAENATLEVIYYDDSGRLCMEYVSNHPGQYAWDESGSIVAGAANGVDAYRNVVIERTGTNTFQTIWYELDKCNFTRGHNQGAQFRLGDYKTNINIKSVKLSAGITETTQLPPPEFAGQSNLNNLENSGIFGYCAWYTAGEGATWNGWSAIKGEPPSPGFVSVEVWPDMTDYRAAGAAMHQTKFSRLGDGSPAVVYNSLDTEVIDTHFKWMQEYGIDCAAVWSYDYIWQSTRNSAPNDMTKFMEAAEKYGRSFYITYDFTDSISFNQGQLLQTWKENFINNVENKGIVSSPNYAHAEGKPVVCIYGIHGSTNYGGYDDFMSGDTDGNVWLRIETASEMVKWLRERGYYVIGMIPLDSPKNWSGHSAAGQALYASVDMLSVWMFYEKDINEALAFCDNNRRFWADNQPVEFMPMIFPGGAWTNSHNHSKTVAEPNMHPYEAGQRAWDAAYAVLGDSRVKTLFFGIADEYNEGAQLLKTASDYFDVPVGQYFLTNSADGWWLSPDFNLRVTGAILEMLRNRTLLREEADIPHSTGPLFWRNSFEQRDGIGKVADGGTIRQVVRPDQRIDPCLNNPELLGSKSSGINLKDNDIIKTAGNSGDNAFSFSGSGSGTAIYKIADVKISTTDMLELKYAILPLDSNGSNVFADILFDDGSLLSETVSTAGTSLTVNQWNSVTVEIPAAYAGKEITGIAAGYKGSGSFSAYIDDIIISSAGQMDMTQISDFVTRLYLTITEREPDAAGLKGWVNLLAAREMTGAQVAYGFFFSDEMKKKQLENDEFITLLYNALMGRIPGSGELTDWVEIGDTVDYEVHAKEKLFQGFVMSNEFLEICQSAGIERGEYWHPASNDTDGFVIRTYNLCLGRYPSDEEMQTWVNDLKEGRKGGTDIVLGFTNSLEFSSKNLGDRAYIEILYNVFLDRPSDAGGRADWLSRLETQTRDQVLRGISGSQEFADICEKFGIRS